MSRYHSRLSGGGDGKNSLNCGFGGDEGRLCSDNGGDLRSRRRSVFIGLFVVIFYCMSVFFVVHLDLFQNRWKKRAVGLV